jgi:protein SCO1/2
MWRYVLLTFLLVLAGGARAELSSPELAKVSLAPPSNAAVPLGLSFQSTARGELTLREVIEHRPSLLLFVDYTCRTVCGPALAIASGALADTGLNPARDFRLVVVGLDEKDSEQDALAMSEHLLDPALRSATAVLRGSHETILRLTGALGYQYSYDPAADQFAHPAGAIVLTPEGRVSKVLSSLALNSTDLRLALVEAGEGRIGSLGDRLTLLCYGFDAVHGVYSLAATRLLQLLTVLTIFGLLGLIIRAHRARNAAGDAR